ncbi:hypothetical protein H6F87_26180 [Cyanobacteria bacterium FACHB-502]|nr:hypothetical protein [Cyanobacteria bacterium FACHB-502]
MPPEESQEKPLINALPFLVAAAKADPENMELQEIWQTIDQLQQEEIDWQQLHLLGDVILQLAERYENYANLLLLDWEERHDPLGPPIQEGLLDGLVQRTMYLDISDLTKKPTRRSKGKKQPESEDNPSIAQPVEKKKVLAFVEAQEESIQTKAQALAVAHDENVSEWIRLIQSWMQKHAQEQESISFVEILRGTGLPVVKAWLALLLGEFELCQQGSFYNDVSITVRLVKEKT